MAQTKARNLSHVERDKGYRFTDRDPAMVELCQMITDSGWSVTRLTAEVRKVSSGMCSLSPSTVSNWLSGKTKRPQNYTLNWAGFALGYERKWRRV